MTAPRHRSLPVTVQGAVIGLLLAGVLLYCVGGLSRLLHPEPQTILAPTSTTLAFAEANGVMLYEQACQSGFCIPRSALCRDAEGTAVFIAKGGQAHRHTVTVLAETDAAALVTSPALQAGDAVMVDADAAYEGMPIR